MTSERDAAVWETWLSGQSETGRAVLAEFRAGARRGASNESIYCGYLWRPFGCRNLIRLCE
jgi:hypothetical protein